MTQAWLQDYLLGAIQRRLCTKIQCTTCGALEFRRGVLEAFARVSGTPAPALFDESAATTIAEALREVRPLEGDARELQAAVRCVIYDIDWVVGPGNLEEILSGSWSGEVLRKMQDHWRASQEARRKYEKENDPENVRRRREEMKRFKQEAHQKRLELKKERDRLWREQQGEGD